MFQSRPKTLADERETPKHNFYDVDRVKELLKKQSLQPRPRIVLRLARQLTRSLDSVSGLFVAFGGITVVYGVAVAVIIGALYGALAFWAVFGGSLALLSLYVDRKVGKSIQFGDYSVLRRGLATTVGFVLVIGTLFLLLIVAGLIHA